MQATLHNTYPITYSFSAFQHLFCYPIYAQCFSFTASYLCMSPSSYNLPNPLSCPCMSLCSSLILHIHQFLKIRSPFSFNLFFSHYSPIIILHSSPPLFHPAPFSFCTSFQYSLVVCVHLTQISTKIIIYPPFYSP